MASTLKPLPPIPAPTARLVNPATGAIDTPWFLYFKRLDEHIREIEGRIDQNETDIADLDTRVTALETP